MKVSEFDVNMPENPRVILLFSGKRKSGKDYVTDILQNRIGDDLGKIIRLSGPIKQQFALDNSLDYEKLLSASEYKEKYRLDMIAWSEAKRREDPGFFIRAAIDMYGGRDYPVWIVSDMRRRSDLQWFQDNYGKFLHTVRIKASLDSRKERGWVFTPGVDDAETECDLDSVINWNQEIDNSSGSSEKVEQCLKDLIKLCLSKIENL